jgi:uncharacterized protein DUF3168
MIGATLFSVLSQAPGVAALAETRIYPQIMPQGGKLPAIVYAVVLEVPENTLGGWTSGLSNARVQIDAYAKGYVAAQTLADAVSGALATKVSESLCAVLLSRRDDYEDETQLHRVSLYVSLWVS